MLLLRHLLTAFSGCTKQCCVYVRVLQVAAPLRAASCDCTTAHMATAAGHLGCLRYLLASYRSFATHRNSLGQTPLHLVQHSATSTHCHAITATLLARFPQHSGEIRATDHTGATALGLTLQQQAEPDTEAAAAATADTVSGDVPAAVQHNSSFCLHCAHQLMQAGASVSSAAQCRLLVCAALQHASLATVSIAADFVKLLVRQQQCPLNDLLRTAALSCSSEQDYIRIEVLLQSGADARALDKGLTLLHQIAQGSSSSDGASRSVSNGRLLRLLVQRRSHGSSSEMLAELIGSRVLHARTCDGSTALHLAWAHPEHVQTLLELGARVNERNTAGHTPLVSTYLLLATIDMLLLACCFSAACSHLVGVKHLALQLE
jgi:hypothetical protein